MKILNFLLIIITASSSLHATLFVEDYNDHSHTCAKDVFFEPDVQNARILFNNKISKDYIKNSRIMDERFFKHNTFILSRQTDEEFELDDEQNIPEMKKLSRTSIVDGRVYDAQGRLADNRNNTLYDETDHEYDFNYVISKKGDFFIMPASEGCHSYILKSSPHKPYYGIGKPVACAGKVSLHEGKIISFDIDSGHYWPKEDQLIVAAHYMAKYDVFHENALIGIHDYKRLPKEFVESYPPIEWEYKAPVKLFLKIDPQPILNRYR